MVNIPFPKFGRDDSESDGKQSLDTTRSAPNIRWVNPRTRRGGGARRAGMTAESSGLAVEELRGACSVVWDEGASLAVALDTPTLQWEESGPSKGNAYSVKLTPQGDVVTLEGGTHVTIRNREGVLTKTITLPKGECRALATDASLEQFYVGVSDGDEDPEIFCYSRHPTRGWELLWRIDAAGYIEKLLQVNALLYAALNDTETGRAYVARFTSLQTQAALFGVSQVPYPANVLDVSTADKNRGKIAVGSGHNATRGRDPRHPDVGVLLDRVFRDWSWEDIDNFDDRRWCDFDPSTLDLEDGDAVHLWQDVGNSQRFFEVPPETVSLTGSNSIGTLSTNFNDGDTVTFALPDGTYSETYRFKNTLAQAYDVKIDGTSAKTTLQNFEDTVENGGDGTNGHQDTPSSSLAFMSNVGGSASTASATFRCNTFRNVVLLSESSSNFGFSSDRIASTKDVVPTPPTFKANGAAGRPCVYFDGESNKLVTRNNASRDPAKATEQHTVWPGYGINNNVDSSARFAYVMVFKPYPQHTKTTVMAQIIDLAAGATWTRRVVWNRDSAGAYSFGTLGVVERDSSTNRTHATDVEGLVMLSVVHNPNSAGPGEYEVYINGDPALNDVASGTGTAVANDSIGRTALGQSSAAPVDDRFWQGEIHRIRTIHRPDAAPITTAERELQEGEMAWEYGLQDKLPVGHPYKSAPPPPPSGSTSGWYTARKVTGTLPILTTVTDEGDIAWIAASDGTSSVPIGGLGYLVKWNSEGDVYSGGPPVVFADDPSSVCKIVDEVEDYRVEWAAQIGARSRDTFTYNKLEAAVDQYDNLYIPWQSDTSNLRYLFLVYDSDGTVLYDDEDPRALSGFSIAVEESSSPVELASRAFLATRREWSMLLHIPASFPGPSTALSNLDGKGVVFEFEGLQQPFIFKSTPTPFSGVPGDVYDVVIGATRKLCLENLRDAMLLYSTSVEPLYVAPAGIDDTVSPLTLRLVALVRSQGVNPATVSPDAGYVNAGNAPYGGGTLFFDSVEADQTSLNIKAYDLIGSLAPTGDTKERAVVTVQGGAVNIGLVAPTTLASDLSATARYVQSATLLGKVFTTDGSTTVVIDPMAGTVESYKPRTSGAFPKGVLGLEPWRARLVAFGIREDPYSLFGTAIGDPFDCDSGRDSVNRAFYRTVGDAGRCEDIVQGFIPYSDFLRQGAEISAIVLGDHSMWRLTGDPTFGGQLENISRTIGGAAGRAWGLGPRNEIYVWASTGGVYVLGAGSGPQPFTGRNVSRVYESVDLSTHYMRIAWDQRLRTLYMVACPYGGVDLPSQIFAWEEHGAFWEDTSDHRITDMIVVDADKPNDRKVLMLCSDGVARTPDPDAVDDDGHRINASVTIGPIQGGDLGVDVILARLQAIIEFASEPMRVEVWGSQYPSSLGEMLWSARIEPGVSRTLSVRRRANFLWIVLRGSQPWAFERMVADILPGSVLGRTR